MTSKQAPQGWVEATSYCAPKNILAFKTGITGHMHSAGNFGEWCVDRSLADISELSCAQTDVNDQGSDVPLQKSLLVLKWVNPHLSFAQSNSFKSSLLYDISN
jgi:hypothetical protein